MPDRPSEQTPSGHTSDRTVRSGKTKYGSIHRYKGLEARAVVLTDIDGLDTEHDRDLFSIGATRATQRLVVLAHVQTHGDLSSSLRRGPYDG